MAVSVTIFLLCFVLPKFGGIFVGKEHLLPAPTKILMGSSEFMRSYWYFILPAVALIIGGFMFFINTVFLFVWNTGPCLDGPFSPNDSLQETWPNRMNRDFHVSEIKHIVLDSLFCVKNGFLDQNKTLS